MPRSVKVAICKRDEGDLTVNLARQILPVLGINAELSYLESGKPVLSDGTHVSVSHSHGLFVMAVAKDVIGVDLEKIRPVNYVPVLKRLGEADCDLISFFKLWTRVESVFKADGADYLSYKTSELKTLSFSTGEYVLSISSTDFEHSVEFLDLTGDEIKFEILR